MIFPKTKISSSLYNSYKNCPYGFYLTVVLELQQKEGPALALGSMWDLMFKEFHEGNDPFEAVKQNKDLWSNPATKQQIDHMGICRKWLEEYSKNPYKFEKAKFNVGYGIPLVHPFTKEVLEFPVSGYLDGIDLKTPLVDGIEVKTTRENYTQQRVDTEFQATMYIYYMYYTYQQLFPLHYIVFNKKTGKVEKFTTTRTLEDFAKMFDDLKQFIENVKSEKFLRNSDHPFYCPCRELG